MTLPLEEKDDFLEAAQDLRYLLGKGYPRTGALTFVGNRYQLPKPQREVLYRGVYPGHEALVRKRRLLGPEAIKGRAVGVDGYNVIITLESALLGRELVECDDGLVRDAAWVSGSFHPTDTTDQALDLILDFLAEHGSLSIVFFLYAPMSLSRELGLHVTALLAGRSLMGRAQAVADPKSELRDFPGLAATSDSLLIDRVAEPLDLAGLIIRRRLPRVPRTALGQGA
jgi:hypothetical protein